MHIPGLREAHTGTKLIQCSQIDSSDGISFASSFCPKEKEPCSSVFFLLSCNHLSRENHKAAAAPPPFYSSSSSFHLHPLSLLHVTGKAKLILSSYLLMAINGVATQPVAFFKAGLQHHLQCFSTWLSQIYIIVFPFNVPYIT